MTHCTKAVISQIFEHDSFIGIYLSIILFSGNIKRICPVSPSMGIVEQSAPQQAQHADSLASFYRYE